MCVNLKWSLFLLTIHPPIQNSSPAIDLLPCSLLPPPTLGPFYPPPSPPRYSAFISQAFSSFFIGSDSVLQRKSLPDASGSILCGRKKRGFQSFEKEEKKRYIGLSRPQPEGRVVHAASTGSCRKSI